MKNIKASKLSRAHTNTRIHIQRVKGKCCTKKNDGREMSVEIYTIWKHGIIVNYETFIYSSIYLTVV